MTIPDYCIHGAQIDGRFIKSVEVMLPNGERRPWESGELFGCSECCFWANEADANDVHFAAFDDGGEDEWYIVSKRPKPGGPTEEAW